MKSFKEFRLERLRYSVMKIAAESPDIENQDQLPSSQYFSEIQVAPNRENMMASLSQANRKVV